MFIGRRTGTIGLSTFWIGRDTVSLGRETFSIGRRTLCLNAPPEGLGEALDDSPLSTYFMMIFSGFLSGENNIRSK
jgi:hypothetical protein